MSKVRLNQTQNEVVKRALQLGRDCLTPGYAGERARMRSAYQLSKQLGLHQKMDAQCHSQDFVSLGAGAARHLNQGINQGLTTARDYWRDQAGGASGLYRGVVGAGQGLTGLGEAAYHGSKALARLSLATADLGYRTLNGETNLAQLAKGAQRTAEVLSQRGARYFSSGQFLNDGKKFSRNLCDYASRLKSDPALEVPKAAVVLSAAVLVAAPRRVAAAAESVSELASLSESSAAVSESLTAVSESVEAVSQGARAVARPLQLGTPGGIVPRGFAPRPLPVAAPPVNQEMLSNLRQALKLSQQAAPKAPPAPPVPVELPASCAPLPVRTPVCLPSNGYAPLPGKGYMQLQETLEGGLDIVG